MTRTIFSRRLSPKNMCSVRQRPMPWAPSARALRASSGVSAFARTSRRRNSSAHVSTVRKCSLISGSTSGTSSVVMAPVVPSMVTTSPSRSTARPSSRTSRAMHVDLQVARARDRRHAHAARHQRGVARLPTLGGQHAHGGVKAGDVVRLGGWPHQDDVASCRGGCHGVPGEEDDLDPWRRQATQPRP